MHGPIILDLVGPKLQPDERELLQHPLVAGVILFARNYESPQQITQLCHDIRASRKTPLLITVDQEGGRVQRFRQGFVQLPSMGQLGKLYQQDKEHAQQLTEVVGWLLASEVLSVGVDLSFAPVLDLNKQQNTVIGDRAFHQDPTIVITLAHALIKGMQQAGMAAVGKHFPGHGAVTVDSHLGMPIDQRTFPEVANDDLLPFTKLIQLGIQGIMPAHITFPLIDNNPVGFSSYWLQKILRGQLAFSGVIVSDDLNMQGAAIGTDYTSRAEAALLAGCDMILICNNRPAALQILNNLSTNHMLDSQKFALLQGRFTFDFTELHTSAIWKEKYDYFRSTN